MLPYLWPGTAGVNMFGPRDVTDSALGGRNADKICRQRA
jgi:hypothetical protein